MEIASGFVIRSMILQILQLLGNTASVMYISSFQTHVFSLTSALDKQMLREILTISEILSGGAGHLARAHYELSFLCCDIGRRDQSETHL